MPHGYSRFDTLTHDQKKALERMMEPIKGKQFDITRSPSYQQALQQLQGLSQYYQGLLSPDSKAYEAQKAPMMREFQEQIMPGIAERFAGVGGMSSSGFNQTAAQAGSSLEERLAALRSGLQMQGAQGLAGVSQQQAGLSALPYEMQMQLAQLNQNRYATALGTPSFGFLQKPQSSASRFGSSFAGGFGRAIPGAISGFLKGGPHGAAIGAGTGFALGAADQWVPR